MAEASGPEDADESAGLLGRLVLDNLATPRQSLSGEEGDDQELGECISRRPSLVDEHSPPYRASSPVLTNIATPERSRSRRVSFNREVISSVVQLPPESPGARAGVLQSDIDASKQEARREGFTFGKGGNGRRSRQPSFNAAAPSDAAEK